jgi:hypothetical protein
VYVPVVIVPLEAVEAEVGLHFGGIGIRGQEALSRGQHLIIQILRLKVIAAYIALLQRTNYNDGKVTYESPQNATFAFHADSYVSNVTYIHMMSSRLFNFECNVLTSDQGLQMLDCFPILVCEILFLEQCQKSPKKIETEMCTIAYGLFKSKDFKIFPFPFCSRPDLPFSRAAVLWVCPARAGPTFQSSPSPFPFLSRRRPQRKRKKKRQRERRCLRRRPET